MWLAIVVQPLACLDRSSAAARHDVGMIGVDVCFFAKLVDEQHQAVVEKGPFALLFALQFLQKVGESRVRSHANASTMQSIIGGLAMSGS